MYASFRYSLALDLTIILLAINHTMHNISTAVRVSHGWRGVIASWRITEVGLTSIISSRSASVWGKHVAWTTLL
ncbi:hypothetical protein BKA82DRAFT_4185236, partial [Pisolithus tinctorius]